MRRAAVSSRTPGGPSAAAVPREERTHGGDVPVPRAGPRWPPRFRGLFHPHPNGQRPESGRHADQGGVQPSVRGPALPGAQIHVFMVVASGSVGRRMRWARSPGGGGHGAVAEVGVEGDHEAGGAFVEAERQELFAFLAGGERLVAARQRCDRRHRAAALAATAGRRGDPAHQTRTRGVRPAGGPVPCTGVRQTAARSGRKDLAPVIAASNAISLPQAWCPPGCRGSGITRSLRSSRPGAVMLDTSRPSPGSVAA